MQIKYFRNERLEDLQTKICLNKNETNILIWLQEKSHSLQKVVNQAASSRPSCMCSKISKHSYKSFLSCKQNEC